MLDLKTRSDLQKLIDEGIQESLTLDYKDSRALCKTNDGRAELVKDVTAFANSAGGQIVYGIPENNGTPQPLDSGVDCEQIPPEWIEQVIDTNAAPRVQGIRITKIGLEPTRPNMVAYVISIPQATAFAPHQNSLDKKYYRRFERRSVPMHDYEIRDLLRRGQTPALVVRITFQGRDMFVPFVKPDQPFVLETDIENMSIEPALYSVIELCYDKRLTLGGSAEKIDRKPDLVFGDNSFQRLQLKFVVPDDFPLMKGSTVSIGPPHITLAIPHEHFKPQNNFVLAYNAIAPGFHETKIATLALQHNRLTISEFSTWEDRK